MIKETAASVAFYVISVDDDQSRVEKYARAYEFDDLPVLFDLQRQALTTFNIRFVPQYILLTPEGRVLARWNGVRRYALNKLKPSINSRVCGDASKFDPKLLEGLLKK